MHHAGQDWEPVVHSYPCNTMQGNSPEVVLHNEWKEKVVTLCHAFSQAWLTLISVFLVISLIMHGLNQAEINKSQKSTPLIV